MQSNPKVSVIIPVYNGTNYMQAAIDSALAQTYDNIEVIVVNDGSSDGGRTDLTARQYGDRIRYICKENGGVASALNAGIVEAQGDYISWLSHDDVYLPQKIEKQVNALRKAGRPAVVVSNVRSIDDKGRILRDQILPERISLSVKCFLALEAEVGINGCSLLCPIEGLKKSGGFRTDLKTTQDYDMWFKLADEYEFIYVRDVLVLSRQHDAQDSRQKGDICLRESDELHARFVRNLSPDEIDHFFSGDMKLLADTYAIYKNAGYKTTAVEIFRKAKHLFSRKLGHADQCDFFNNEVLQFEAHTQASRIIRTLKKTSDVEAPNKPRIMFYVNVWFRGGMERVIANLTSRLQEKYSIFLVSMENKEYPEGFPLHDNLLHVEIARGDAPHLFPYRLALLAAFLEIDIFIGNPNILIEFLAVYDLMRKVRIRSIAWNHYNFFLPYHVGWLHPVARERLEVYKSVDVVVWMTSFSTKAYSQLLPNGATMPNPNSFPVQERRVGGTGKVVIVVGRFYDYIKRVDYALDAFKLVLKKHPDAKLLLVGGYDMNLFLPDRGGLSLEEFVGSLSLPSESYRFEGEQERVESYYEQACVLIQTSSSEGFSLVLNEAGCFGVPCVMFEVPGLDDLITDGENGFVVSQRDVVGMAEKVSQLLDDRCLRERMGSKSQDMARRFDSDVLCDRWDRLLSAVLDNPQQEALNGILEEKFQSVQRGNGAFCRALAKEYDGALRTVLSPRESNLGSGLNHFRLTDEEYRRMVTTENGETRVLLAKLDAAYEHLNRNQAALARFEAIAGHPAVRALRAVYLKAARFIAFVKILGKRFGRLRQRLGRTFKTEA